MCWLLLLRNLNIGCAGRTSKPKHFVFFRNQMGFEIQTSLKSKRLRIPKYFKRTSKSFVFRNPIAFGIQMLGTDFEIQTSSTSKSIYNMHWPPLRNAGACALAAWHQTTAGCHGPSKKQYQNLRKSLAQIQPSCLRGSVRYNTQQHTYNHTHTQTAHLQRQRGHVFNKAIR